MSAHDLLQATEILVAMVRARTGISPDKVDAFVHAGAPASKARARQGPRGFYTPSSTKSAQEALSWQFQGSKHGAQPLTCNVAIVAIFYRPNLQRIDTDNMMKLVLDAGTKAEIWRDDCQVSAHAAFVELDAAAPRTVVAWCPYTGTLNRAPLVLKCRTCGKAYERAAWQKKGLAYCSGLCAQARRLSPATCPRLACGRTFQRTTAGQVYCSMACRNAERGVRLPNGEQRPRPTCERCGGPVSKQGYLQCRACRGYGRPTGAKDLRPRKGTSAS